MKRKVFDVLNRATGKSVQGGSKLTAMADVDARGALTGHVWREPSEVLAWYWHMLLRMSVKCMLYRSRRAWRQCGGYCTGWGLEMRPQHA